MESHLYVKGLRLDSHLEIGLLSLTSAIILVGGCFHPFSCLVTWCWIIGAGKVYRMIMLLHFPPPCLCGYDHSSVLFCRTLKKKKKATEVIPSSFCFDVLVWKCFLVFWSNVYGSYYPFIHLAFIK